MMAAVAASTDRIEMRYARTIGILSPSPEVQGLDARAGVRVTKRLKSHRATTGDCFMICFLSARGTLSINA